MHHEDHQPEDHQSGAPRPQLGVVLAPADLPVEPLEQVDAPGLDRLALPGSGAGRRPARRRSGSGGRGPSPGTSGRSSPGPREGPVQQPRRQRVLVDHLPQRLERGRRANGGRPVRHSYRIAPRAYTSAAGPTSFASPRRLLRGHVARRAQDRPGLRRGSLPLVASWPGRSRSPSACRRRPAARSPASGRGGRCPGAWAAVIARGQVARPVRPASRGGSGVPPSFVRQGAAGQYSRARNGCPSCSPTSYTWTMFGCCSRPTASASARNRDRRSAPTRGRRRAPSSGRPSGSATSAGPGRRPPCRRGRAPRGVRTRAAGSARPSRTARRGGRGRRSGSGRRTWRSVG